MPITTRGPKRKRCERQLAGWRQDHAGDDVILVSTGLRAELFLADQVDTLVINGTRVPTATT